MTDHWFVVPPLEGPPSGGTLYNRELVRELQNLGLPIRTLELVAAVDTLAAGAGGVYWVDTLFLGHFAALVRANRQGRTLGLLAHYLPSLVEQGDGAARETLRHDESHALAHCDIALAPSVYMKRALSRLGLAAGSPCLVVEPGCLTQGLAASPAGLE